MKTISILFWLALWLVQTINNAAPTSFCKRLADGANVVYLPGTSFLRVALAASDKRLLLAARIPEPTARRRNEEGDGREAEVAGGKENSASLRGGTGGGRRTGCFRRKQKNHLNACAKWNLRQKCSVELHVKCNTIIRTVCKLMSLHRKWKDVSSLLVMAWQCL